MKPDRMSNFKFWVICVVVMTLAMVLGFWIKPAEAAFQCKPWLPRDQAIAILIEKYGESVIGTGVYENPQHGPSTFEMWHNPKTGTWTAVTNLRKSDNKWISCAIVSGDSWLKQEAITPKEGTEL